MSIRVTDRPLSVGAAYRELDDVQSGGVTVFAGRVRPDAGSSGAVVALFYEAHRSMALKSLARLARDAERKLGARRVVLWHRTGLLRVGTISVIVGAAAAHRAAAFAACRFLIDGLKERAPIWKTDRVRPARPRRRRRGPRAAR